ncbi:MAG TPA: glycoside hydrolase family 3 N-terminal domain-containing protein, partial [Cellvibrio sp.]|nr:glycoside hydrolase family 3 N-terminal domain-containing protein [Cellvibrio sp.]
MSLFRAHPLRTTLTALLLGASTGALAQAPALTADSLSLKQKIGQLQQMHVEAKTAAEIPEELKAAIRNGQVGSILNIPSPEVANELQRIAMTESAAKIPLIFARDVIHGYRTIMPTPLGQAASWNADLVEKGARAAAVEASSMGIRWTFAPMIDISRDSRWGRITESFGEDSHLTSVLTV